MSYKKNKEILDNIMKENYLGLNEKALVSRMLKNELAGQRVFYLWLKQNGFDINPEAMDKNRSDGIVGNTIIECKLNESEGGGVRSAYQELFNIIPNRLKQNGEKIPFFRIYVELETCLVEVYDCHCKLRDRFNWYIDFKKLEKYFEDKTETYEYDLSDEQVDLVEVIQNLYKIMGVKTKREAYSFIEAGLPGWFKPFDINKANINRLILNNDKMNEKYVQKKEGAFFTPPQYVRISTSYVLNAIKESKKDGYDDYVIIDRACGVANLESQFDEEIYSHMILGTINEAEAFTANIRLNGLAQVEVIDAVSKEGVEYYIKVINDYKVKNNVNKLAVIFLENPPYALLNNNKKGGLKSDKVKTYVHIQMNSRGWDLDEQFVFSAFKYYNIYAYIHYGPIKIWKTKHLVSKEVKEAYLCNRKYFNAGESAIALIRWGKDDKNYEEIEFDSDIEGKFVVKKVHKPISELYKNDAGGVCFFECKGFGFMAPRLDGGIDDGVRYKRKWVSKENLLNVAPLFCVSRDEVSETGVIDIKGNKDYRIIDTVYKTSDGGDIYRKDKQFLQDCLLYTLCTQKNTCGTDSKFFKAAEELLDNKHKSTVIYSIYHELCNTTKLNGLVNIEKYKKEEYGKLWKEHELFPKIKKLKELLREFHINTIRPKMLEYELLK